MDKARKLTGLTDKISITRLSHLMSHFDLHVNENLVFSNRVNVAVTSHATDAYPGWQNVCLSGPLKPNTTYTISVSAISSDPRVTQASIRIWNDRTNTELAPQGAGEWIFPADGKRHSYTFTTDHSGVSEGGNYNYTIWAYAGPMGNRTYGYDFTTTYTGIKLEYGDLATPLTDKQEIIKPNLIPSQFNTTGWIIECPIVKDSEGINTIQLVPGGSGIDKGANIGLTGVDFTSTYTWTFWARADNAGDKLHTELWGGQGSNDIPLTTEWEKYQAQGKFLPRLQALYFWGPEGNKGDVYVKLPYIYLS